MTFLKGFLKLFSAQIMIMGLTLSVSQIASAGIYKWVDEQGNVHYGEQRPQNTSSQKMQVQKYAPENKSTYKRPSYTPSTKSTNKNTQDNPPEKKKETRAEKKKRLAACEKTRANLKMMEEIGRIRAKDKDGNTRYLSQKEKEAKMQKNREQISKYCK